MPVRVGPRTWRTHRGRGRRAGVRPPSRTVRWEGQLLLQLQHAQDIAATDRPHHTPAVNHGKLVERVEHHPARHSCPERALHRHPLWHLGNLGARPGDCPQISGQPNARTALVLGKPFGVENIEAVAGLRARGAELVGELEQYEDNYRPCFVRALEGIIVALACQLS